MIDIIHRPYLILHLKKKYFDEIKAGTKDHELRQANDYWTRRLCGPPGQGIFYDLVLLASGYPKRNDTDRWMAFTYSGYHNWVTQHEIFGTHPVPVYAISVPQRNRTELPPGWV